jgi:hypothetical protein
MKGTWRTPALAIIVALSAPACGSHATGSAPAQSTPTASASPTPSSSPAGSTTFHNYEYNFDVTYPSSWKRATEQLTILGEPDELLAVGTFDLVKGGGCAPKNSGAAAGPEDAIVFLTEYSSVKGTDFPPRPDSFAPLPPPEPNDCWDVPVSVYQFRDQDGRFEADVWTGAGASEQTRTEAADILDSLVFGTRDGVGPFFDRIVTYLRVKGSSSRIRRPSDARRRHAVSVRALKRKVTKRLRKSDSEHPRLIEHMLAVHVSKDDRLGHFRRLSYIVHTGPFDTGDCLDYYDARTLDYYLGMCFITNRDL